MPRVVKTEMLKTIQNLIFTKNLNIGKICREFWQVVAD